MQTQPKFVFWRLLRVSRRQSWQLGHLGELLKRNARVCWGGWAPLPRFQQESCSHQRAFWRVQFTSDLRKTWSHIPLRLPENLSQQIPKLSEWPETDAHHWPTLRFPKTRYPNRPTPDARHVVLHVFLSWWLERQNESRWVRWLQMVACRPGLANVWIWLAWFVCASSKPANIFANIKFELWWADYQCQEMASKPLVLPYKQGPNDYSINLRA